MSRIEAYILSLFCCSNFSQFPRLADKSWSSRAARAVHRFFEHTHLSGCISAADLSRVCNRGTSILLTP